MNIDQRTGFVPFVADKSVSKASWAIVEVDACSQSLCIPDLSWRSRTCFSTLGNWTSFSTFLMNACSIARQVSTMTWTLRQLYPILHNYDSICCKALRSARGAKGYLHDVAVQQPACHNTVLQHFSPRGSGMRTPQCCQETCSLLEAALSQHKASMFADKLQAQISAKPTDLCVWSYKNEMTYEFESQISRGIQIIKSMGMRKICSRSIMIKHAVSAGGW